MLFSILCAAASAAGVTNPREILTLPTLRAHPAVAANTTSPIGPELSSIQLEFRLRRARELDQLFASLTWALPAEISAALGERWTGQFVRARLSPRTHRTLVNAIVQGHAPSVRSTRTEPGRRVTPAQPLLVTWIDALAAAPMTLASLPGEVVDTPVGPVVIDATNEPFRVTAAIGAALIAPDGQVLHRTHARYEAVLRGDHAVDITALELAHSVATEVARAWELPD